VPDDVASSGGQRPGRPAGRTSHCVVQRLGQPALRRGASLAVSGDASLFRRCRFFRGGGLGFSGGAGAGAGLSVTETAGRRSPFCGRREALLLAPVHHTRALLPPASVASGQQGTGGFDLAERRASGGGSLNAIVGASADLSARIGFSD